MEVDRQFVMATLAALVRTNSVNPRLAPGAPGEAEIASFIAATMRGLGLEVETIEPEPGRVSVLAWLRGAGGGRNLMLNGHVDTVGVEGMTEPFSGAVREGKLFGRGAYDMKGSIAAAMGALKALAESGARLRGDVVLAVVADEEYGSLGTESIIPRAKVDGAIVAEPTALDVCLAHKGYLWIEVETIGRAAHGSKFELGIDANMRMGRFLAGLDRLERELRARPPHPLVGPPSLHAAMVQGGAGLSTYAQNCKLQIERRTIPGESESQVMGEIQAIINRLAASDPTFQATARAWFVRQPFEVPPDAAVVKAVSSAARAVRGTDPAHIGDTPWMDSALLAAEGIECVIIGPSGAGAHAAEEWVDVESVVRLAEILALAATGYCG